MPFFDSEVIALRQGDSLSGSWVKHLADRDAIMPFQAVRGVAYRFLEYPEPPIANISGRWATGFVREGDTSIAIGELRQEETRLDRNSVVEGKGVAVSVDLGGGGYIKK